MKPDYDKLCALPGADGCMWRLFRVWDPDNIITWLKGEYLRGTDPMVTGPQFARVIAAATMLFAKHTDNVHAAITAKKGGVVPAYEQAMRLLLDQYGQNKTKGGIIVPTLN